MKEPTRVHLAQHGTQIFFYNNIRTNQIIYSLTRSLNNNTSLKQLPFLGKKTVPSHLRKDLWQPFCLVSFPRPSQGLIAYRRLREFRRLHETSYPLSLIKQSNGNLHSTKKRGKILMDQKANSVADLAAVLLRAEDNLLRIGQVKREADGETEQTEMDQETEKEMEKRREEKREKRKKEMREKRIEAKEKRTEWIRRLQKAGKKSFRRKDPQPPEQGGVEGVKISWANLLDSEFAQQWPEAVVHDGLARHRYTAAFPLKEQDGERRRSGIETADVPVELLPVSGGSSVPESRA
ncbi:MAG: hypothetical protein Q9172_006191 [Xanthocarpia lactea]